jgi:hypothetical protein
MPMSEFRIGQRVYYHYPPSGGDRTWYGYIIDYIYEWGVWVYTIQFDGIDTPQKYSNTEDTMLIFSDEPLIPTWEV